MNVESTVNIRPFRIFEDQIGAGKKKKGFYILKKGRRQYVNKKIIVHKKKYKRPVVTPRLLTKINNTNKKVVGDILKNNLSKSTIGKLSQDVFKNIKGDVSKVGEVNTTYNIQKDVGDIKKVIGEVESFNNLTGKLKKAKNNVVISNALVRDSKKLMGLTQEQVTARLNQRLSETEKMILKEKYDAKYFDSKNNIKKGIFKDYSAGKPRWDRTKEILRSIYGPDEGKRNAAKIYNFEVFDLKERAKKGEELKPETLLDEPAEFKDIEAAGQVNLKGMNDLEINSVMDQFKKAKYAGTFSYDELWDFLKNTDKDDFCCIFNSVERDNQIVGHWIAFNCDKKTRSLEIYDSYGDNLGKGEWEKIMAFTNRISPEIAWEYKPNGIQEQHDKSDTCGWFSIRFLLARRINKLSFEDSTGFSNIAKNEKEILKLKKQFHFI